MGDIRSILLHLDASPSSHARLALAHALADRHDARVTALFGVRPGSSQSTFGYSAAAALQAAQAHELAIEAERARLRDRFALGERQCVWCDIVGDSLVHGFVAEAAYADLLVLGAPSPGDDGGAPAGFVESVVLQSGAPALIVPELLRTTTVGERVLIAWNGSAPAARAVKAALPLLRRAEQVDVVSWARVAPSAPFSGLGLDGWLLRHGVRATMHAMPPLPHVARELQTQALQRRADLVVMGCYGHSRLREQVFGGVTRGLLAALPISVLMAH
jgi:nucleotide-binding universal stress UspA family protein